MTNINTHYPYLIVGDFNINEVDSSNNTILSEISDITLTSQLVKQCTTEGNSKIDLA
jgi:hypothetical protein